MRGSGALFLLLVALATAGCGSSEMGAADGETTVEPTPTTALDEGHAAVAWGVTRAQERRPTGPPTAAKLAVFGEPAGPSDSFSGSQDPLDIDEGMPEELRPGRQLFGRARLLIPAADADGIRLYGVPTEKGWVCLHLVQPDEPTVSLSGGCTRNLTEGLDYGMSGNESLFVVYGLVADDAREVKIVAGGRTYPAVLGRNAFLLQAKPRKVCPTELRLVILGRENGKRHELELYAPSGDDTDQAERESYFGCR